MNKFWELFRSSGVLQFSLALLISATICALYLLGREVPMELTSAWMLVLGYVFGSKVQQVIDRANS